MVLKEGEKIHIITRRIFEQDLRRHFAGTIKQASENAIRVEGYAFIYAQSTNLYERRPELRTRIFTTTDSNLIINVIPDDVNIELLQYKFVTPAYHLVLTDGNYKLDINEFRTAR